jgi:hypothetical protein
MNRVRAKLTYANVVSSLCLVLLVGGGTAFAASQLEKESVGTKELAKAAVTPAKLSKAAKKGMVGPAGATGATGPQGAQGPAGPAGAAGAQGAPATALWAVIGVNGETLSAGAGFVSAQRLKNEPGRYVVSFNRDVSQCAMLATSHAGTGVDVFAGPREGNANAVFVIPTVDEAQELDNEFSLGVFC